MLNSVGMIPIDTNLQEKNVQKDVSILEEKLENVNDKQGFLGNFWNSVKEVTTLGVSVSDCENMLEKYNKGEVSFEEAVDYIDKFDSKQENMSGLLSNILTGIGSIAAATVATSAGPIGWAIAFLKGAPVGAALKTSINLLDRATNNIEDDEFNLKQMSKDAISGVFTGATSAISSGVGLGIKTGKISTSILNGVKCGATCGAMSGASSYMTDVAFQDTDFETEDLIKNTLLSSATSALVGGTVGAGMYGTANLAGNIGQNAVNSTSTIGKTIVQDSATSSIRKALGTEAKAAINHTI